MHITKALTFRASSIGDCLMGKYLLENIHAQFPNARLGIVVGSRGAMIRDLLSAYPWLEVIEVNRRSPRALFSLLRNFCRSDLVLTQYAGKPGGRFSLWSKLVARVLAKRDGLIGFADASAWNTMLYDQLIPVRRDVAVAEHERAALRAAKVSISLPFPALAFVRDDIALARFKLETGKYIVAHMFAGNAGRGLHPDKKRELLAALSQKLPNVPLVISGGIADRAEAMRITERIPVTVIAGDTTLQELMNIIAHSRAVVSLDTGVAHIAAHIGVPLVVLRTCVAPNWWLAEQYGKGAPVAVFSSDASCAGKHEYKNYPNCINAITMEDVAEKVASI